MDMIDEFRDTAARLFTDFATAETLEAAERGTLPLDLWNAVNESGFGLVLVPEAHGGIGAGLREAAAILNAAGEHAVPGPLLELMLGNQMLALAGRDVSAAPLSIAFAADEGAKTLRNVPWVRGAEHVLVVAPRGLAIVPAGRLEARPEIADASGEPRARFELPAGTPWLPLPGHDFEGWLRRGALLRGAQMIGAMRWCLDRTTAYTQERKQFGREIGKFQVVQQMMAEMASAVVAAHAILDAAIAEPDSATLTAAARSRLGDAVDTVFALAHQVHGAIGFSHEYVLHFRTRRLLAWRDDYGTVAHWRRQLARSFAGGRADAVWPVIAG